MSEIEGATAVREEDAFDLEAVRTWLAAQGTELVGEVEIQQFGGGASNLTYSLRTADADLILRRPPVGKKAAGAHDMGREFRIQSALKGPFGLVPDMVAFCDDESVLGSEFYVMQRLDGIIPRRDLPPELDLGEAGARDLCRTFVDTLIKLHRVDTSLPEIAAIGKGTGYVERQIRGWSTRYRNALTEDAPGFERVMGWLDEQQVPVEPRPHHDSPPSRCATVAWMIASRSSRVLHCSSESITDDASFIVSSFADSILRPIRSHVICSRSARSSTPRPVKPAIILAR